MTWNERRHTNSYHRQDVVCANTGRDIVPWNISTDRHTQVQMWRLHLFFCLFVTKNYCVSGARRLPTEHISLVMVIKKDGLKLARLKLTYTRSWETTTEPLVDILGRISVKCIVSKWTNPKCDMHQVVVRQGLHFSGAEFDSSQRETAHCSHTCANSSRHLWTSGTISSNWQIPKCHWLTCLLPGDRGG